MKQEKKFYLSKECLEQKKSEYESLKKLRIAKTTENVPVILESEDLNPEYVSFQEDLNRIDFEISELENILKNAVVINSSDRKKESGIVAVGSKIIVQINGEAEDEFTIVGTLEAAPALGRISNESPVGRAFLGRHAGESVAIPSPVKTVYKIKKILS